MPTSTHPIDAPASPSLIAAFILILGFGVLALVTDVNSRSGSMEGASTNAIAAQAATGFGD